MWVCNIAYRWVWVCNIAYRWVWVCKLYEGDWYLYQLGQCLQLSVSNAAATGALNLFNICKRT